MKSLTATFCLLGSLVFCSSADADRLLQVKQAERQEIRHSMIGFRSTLVFYLFEEQRAVLQLLIDNKDETFPVTGKVLLFDAETPVDGLKKWINNQHSDGLFVDVPEPTLTVALPDETARVTAQKAVGRTENAGPRAGVFENFEVEVAVAEFEVDDRFKLSAFKETAKVHVPALK